MIPGTTADWADDRDMYRKRIRELEDQNDALAAELDQLKTALATDVLSAFMRIRELEAALRQIAAYYPLPALSAAEALTVARNALPQSETEAKP